MKLKQRYTELRVLTDAELKAVSGGLKFDEALVWGVAAGVVTVVAAASTVVHTVTGTKG